MYFAGIKPIMDLSRDVIDSAIAGDIAAARKALIVLSHARSYAAGVQSDKLEVAKRLSIEMGAACS